MNEVRLTCRKFKDLKAMNQFLPYLKANGIDIKRAKISHDKKTGDTIYTCSKRKELLFRKFNA